MVAPEHGVTATGTGHLGLGLRATTASHDLHCPLALKSIIFINWHVRLEIAQCAKAELYINVQGDPVLSEVTFSIWEEFTQVPLAAR